jgi:predicted transcriptional regulator
MNNPHSTGNPTVDDLITQLRQRRHDLGITQRHLAELTGISHAYISRIESGYIVCTIQTLSRIAQALGSRLECQIITPTTEDS